MSSASITSYPVQHSTDDQPAIGNKLLIHDKIDLFLWEAACRIPEICRIVIHDQVDAGADQVDFILVYASTSPWARWGLARRDDVIMLWQCSDGADLGAFDTMQAALTAIEVQAVRLRTAGVWRARPALQFRKP